MKDKTIGRKELSRALGVSLVDLPKALDALTAIRVSTGKRSRPKTLGGYAFARMGSGPARAYECPSLRNRCKI